ncbi:MAG TPA: hypothetical protein VFL75_03215 [Candidatus Limnocylindria bacterium]|nr:hypothetical protein [Candidatus Limnocylindria bacterium]
MITSRPVYRMDEAYCCVGCAEGGPCVCSYEADLAEDGVDRLGLLIPVRVGVAAGHRASEPMVSEPMAARR